MHILRGQFDGTKVVPLEAIDVPDGTHVLVLVLDGELERAAARVARQRGDNITRYALGQVRAPQDRDVLPTTQVPPMTVGEIMTEQIVAVHPRMSVVDAMHLMSQEGITSVLVEPGAIGDWGIMTIRDVLDRIVRTNRDSQFVAVGELASRPLVTASCDTTLQACSELMIDHRIRRVVVLDGTQPVGIISETDIFRVIEQYGWDPNVSSADGT
ncbi:MAG: Isocitrate dehydrogenase [NADP] [Chloroflexi bacterium AL-W]|nr:Isocitrate dehydrogenase [NADP] [Chloroflexi bacterium AL-N1]NOK67189.1 Isocitrate dehydrogenase [NADP] [Chloroflexi bacterium AL-N10]NOK75317.1 Isocitrate dehydrogenase [NADP] [Chloroflexi bacterium AL-N5]NOK82105.1 Isocitrate dehydrogenase [NADP] [Chloroflexi bacterium AL-W]NOK89950.1 Isocitrate dehydrogenase [NADP] [Chloroflexi bacterium AL-N15]